VQASGWRAQNPFRSLTVADAAEMASAAPTSLVEEPLCGATLGSSTSTTLSQNAIRNRKNMSPESQATCVTARDSKLAGSLESRVGGLARLLSIVEQNTPQIFEQLDKIEFT
jgi:hypothetical protein